MDYYKAFPFYMGYGQQWNAPAFTNEDRILEDMEYLQQMYPSYAKKYQGVINSVVDKVDYKGSFIYDQYPDKLTLMRMVQSIMAVIKANENGEAELTPGESVPWEEKEPWIQELVTVLMYNDIIKRRRRRE
ncbi:MAG: hypothetical protein NC337_13960 [Roseburia sp.]|nr:hypothetical protein [Roseburia sp.]